MTRKTWLPCKHIDELALLPRTWSENIIDPVKGNQVVTAIDGHMRDISTTIDCIRAFRKKAIKSSADRLFEIIKTKHGRYKIEATGDVGVDFERLYFSLVEVDRRIRSTHILTPFCRVFVDTQRRIPIRWSELKKPHPSEEEALIHLNRLLRFISILTKRFKSENVVLMESNFRRGPKQNFTSTLEFLDACAKTRSNVLMLRVDLHYKRSQCPITEIRDQSNRTIEYFDFDTIAHHRERLTSAIKKKYGSGLVGYVIKLELGYQRGPHFHCLFILDAALHHRLKYHTFEVARIWTEITSVNGSYEYCDPDKYRWKIVGKRDMLNEETRIGLVFFTGYICLHETLLKPRVPSHHRLLTKACIKNPSPPNKVGRPPKARNADSLMNLDISKRLMKKLSYRGKSNEGA